MSGNVDIFVWFLFIYFLQSLALRGHISLQLVTVFTFQEV